MAEEQFFGYSICVPLKVLYKAKRERKKTHNTFSATPMLHPLKKNTTQSFLPCTSQATPDIALSAYNATNHTNMQAIGKQTLKEISLKCVNGQLSKPTNTTKLCQRELFLVWERPVGTLI